MSKKTLLKQEPSLITESIKDLKLKIHKTWNMLHKERKQNNEEVEILKDEMPCYQCEKKLELDVESKNEEIEDFRKN